MYGTNERNLITKFSRWNIQNSLYWNVSYEKHAIQGPRYFVSWIIFHKIPCAYVLFVCCTLRRIDWKLGNYWLIFTLIKKRWWPMGLLSYIYNFQMPFSIFLENSSLDYVKKYTTSYIYITFKWLSIFSKRTKFLKTSLNHQ